MAYESLQSIHTHEISLLAMGFTFQMSLTELQLMKVRQIYMILLFSISHLHSGD